ncbi:enoyl-CoA hydratase-related protein [Microbacterium profundi]|uniref:Enoyl-CoA hydratase-related protein n=1 Tax=Microbacterium profundi TaxID=450380 RepID=A0ABV3LH40_9MICO
MNAAVTAEVVGRAGVITVNRPDALNALTYDVVRTIAQQFDTWRDDQHVHGVVITGAGDRAFAAGADITELQRKRVPEMTDTGMQHWMTAIRESPLPSIAAVSGFALGGGFELALACDIRIATPASKFGFPETGLGIIPGAGGTQLLSRYAGVSVANYHVLTGALMSAERAHQLGLVSELHEPAALRDAAIALVETMAGRGPLALRLAKRAIRASSDTSLAAGLEIELLAQAALFGTEERDEGLAAFIGKRQPDF